MKKLKWFCLLISLLSADALHANDNLLLYGVEIAPDNPYLYLGAIIPVVTENDTWVIRLWSDISEYEYDAYSTTIKAQSRNMHIAIGNQFIHDNGWLTAYLGYAYNHTDLDPVDPANEVRGTNKQLLVSADGEMSLPSCDNNLNYGISYLLEQKAYWARVRPICWTLKEYKVGFEVVNHGDDHYNHLQLGGVLYNNALSAGTNITLKAGYTIAEKSDDFPYLGFEFSTRY